MRRRSPTSFGPRITEIVEHLRATLDYLVYEVALHDSGDVQRGTQFVISDSADDFNRQTNRRLKGLSRNSIHIVEQYQPYRFPPLRWLRELSNTSKHQHLHIVGAARGILVGPPGFSAAIGYVAFADGSPVLETLDELRFAVQSIVDRFNDAFARHNV